MKKNLEEEIYEKIWFDKIKNKDNIKTSDLRSFIAMKYLDEGGRILDVGCGEGKIGIVAKEKFKEIHGVDISELALQIAEKNGVIARKVNLNYEELAYEDNFFDAVVCLEVIEHILDPFYLISEIKRVLKPNGVLILTTPNFRKIKNILYLLIKGRFPKTSSDTQLWDGGHIHYFTFKDIKWILEQQKFEIIFRGYILSEEKYIFLKSFFKKILPKNLFGEFIAAGILVKAINKK
jgi:methionine biosynthesis protein MetW